MTLPRTFVAGALIACSAAPLAGQRPYVSFAAGRMLYDAAGDTWHPAITIGAGVAVGNRVRVGVSAGFSHITGFDTLSYLYAGSEHFTRISAAAEWDAVSLGTRGEFNHTPTLYLKGGFGFARSAGHPPFRNPPAGTASASTWHQSGMSATFGVGFRIPVVSRIAMQGGWDFHYDEVLDSHLRNWTWSAAAVITP